MTLSIQDVNEVLLECPIFYLYNLDFRPIEPRQKPIVIPTKNCLGKLFLLQLVNQLLCPDCKELGTFGLKENNGNLT